MARVSIALILYVTTLVVTITNAEVCDEGPPQYQDACANAVSPSTALQPDPDDCTKYYECSGDMGTLMCCPSGLWFDPINFLCNWPYLSGCTPSSPPDNSTTDAPPTGGFPDPRCVNVTLSYWPIPSDCHRYIECIDGWGYNMSCPSDLNFNPTDAKCEDPSESSCVPLSGDPCDGVPNDGEDHVVADPTDCSKYYVCSNGVATPGDCASLDYDPKVQSCNFPPLVDCSGRGNSSNSTTPPSGGSPDPRCIDNATSFWPHPSECTKYIECYEGLAYEMDCPPGKKFNDVDQMCDISGTSCGFKAVRAYVQPRTSASWKKPVLRRAHKRYRSRPIWM